MLTQCDSCGEQGDCIRLSLGPDECNYTCKNCYIRDALDVGLTKESALEDWEFNQQEAGQ